MVLNYNFLKKIKNFSFISLSYFLFFLIGDLIFSNFIFKDKLNIRYDCYEYKTITHNNQSFHDYKLIKNCKATESQKTAAPYIVFTDEEGYRFSGNKRSKKKDNLIFLGDSTTFGIGSKFEDTFVGIVESKMKNYNVYNLGVPGFGLQKYYYVLNEFLRTKTASKIFLTIDMTDFIDAANRWKNIPNSKSPVLESAFVGKEISDWENLRNSNFKGTRLIIFHTRNFIRTIKIKIKILNSKNDKAKNNIKSSHWANFTYTDKKNLTISEDQFKNAELIIENYFRKINILAEENNAELYLIIFPWPENLIYGQEKFNWEIFNEKLCSNNYCSEMINLFRDFREIVKDNDDWQNLIYIKDDIHFTKFGNNFISNKIINIIKN